MLENYTVLDLETTGLDPKKEKIIEIGAVRVKNGNPDAIYQKLVHPGRNIDTRVTELTGITDGMLQDAPYIEALLPELLTFLGDDALIGHRILFDYSFVKKAAVNAGMEFEKTGLDTLKLARVCLPEQPSKRLTDLCSYYGIEYQAHRAYEDALATHRLYRKLCAGYEYAAQAQPEKLYYAVKKEGPITPAQRERLKRMEAFYQISLPYEIEKLTKNEASRIMDQLTAKYGTAPRFVK